MVYQYFSGDHRAEFERHAAPNTARMSVRCQSSLTIELGSTTESPGAWRSGRSGAAASNGALSDVPYNADYFAQKHDISLEQARELMRKIGRDRDKLNEAAAKLFRK